MTNAELREVRERCDRIFDGYGATQFAQRVWTIVRDLLAHIDHLQARLEEAENDAVNYEAALRGEQGMLFEDGYEANVAQLMIDRDRFKADAVYWKEKVQQLGDRAFLKPEVDDG